MIIKDKITVGTREYTIEFQENLSNNGSNVYGLLFFNEAKIKINSSMDEDLQELALIHELRHLVLILCGYDEEEPLPVFDESFLVRQEHYDHQVMLQIVEWQKEK